jgi:DNA polymerase V
MANKTIPPRAADAEILPIHLHLDATPEELWAETLADGADPRLEIQAMRRLGQAQAAKIRADTFEIPPWFAKSFPRFEEAVAAGDPSWADFARGPTDSTFLDILGKSDPLSTIWARVSGWSMRDVGINDGDTILVDTSAEARDGDIVLAHIAGCGQVVKRLRIAGDKAYLDSANPDFQPIEIDDPANLRIHGVVRGRAGKV